MGATFHNQGGPMVEPIVPSASSAWTSRPAALRARGAASTSEASAVEQILDDLSSRVRTNGWNSCSWTAARRGLAPPVVSEVQLRGSPCWMGRPRATSTAPRSSPIRMPGGLRCHGHSCDGDAWRAASRTP